MDDAGRHIGNERNRLGRLGGGKQCPAGEYEGRALAEHRRKEMRKCGVTSTSSESESVELQGTVRSIADREREGGREGGRERERGRALEGERVSARWREGGRDGRREEGEREGETVIEIAFKYGVPGRKKSLYFSVQVCTVGKECI